MSVLIDDNLAPACLRDACREDRESRGSAYPRRLRRCSRRCSSSGTLAFLEPPRWPSNRAASQSGTPARIAGRSGTHPPGAATACSLRPPAWEASSGTSWRCPPDSRDTSNLPHPGSADPGTLVLDRDWFRRLNRCRQNLRGGSEGRRSRRAAAGGPGPSGARHAARLPVAPPSSPPRPLSCPRSFSGPRAATRHRSLPIDRSKNTARPLLAGIFSTRHLGGGALSNAKGSTHDTAAVSPIAQIDIRADFSEFLEEGRRFILFLSVFATLGEPCWRSDSGGETNVRRALIRMRSEKFPRGGDRCFPPLFRLRPFSDGTSIRTSSELSDSDVLPDNS